MSTDVNLSKIQRSKIIQSGAFLGLLLRKNSWSINESSCFIGKKYFSSIRNPLTNFEIQKCYQNEPRFNKVYSRDNLPKRTEG